MPKRLSRRERQVMRGVAAGQTSKEIAALLDIAQSTVDWHVVNALAKLHAANRAEGVAVALQRGELGRGPWRIRARRPGAIRWEVAAALVALLVPVLVAGDVRENAPRPAAPDASPATPPSITAAPTLEFATPPPPATGEPTTLETPAPVASAPAVAPHPPVTTASPALATPVPIVVPLPSGAPAATLPPVPTVVPIPTTPLAPALPPPPTPTLPATPVLPVPTVPPLPSVLPSASVPTLP